jgi:type II secretory pathway component PulM
MQLSPRNRRLLIAGLAIVVLLYIISEVLMPYWDSFGQLHSDVVQKSELLARYKGRVAAKDAYQARLEEHKKRLDSFNTRFLDAVEPAQGSASLLEILTKVASDAGLVLTRKEFQNAKRLNPDYQKISAKIDASCSPEQLVLFLSALRNQEKHLFVDEFTLRSQNIRNNFQLLPSFQVSAIIRSPELKEEKPGKPKAAPAAQAN